MSSTDEVSANKQVENSNNKENSELNSDSIESSSLTISTPPTVTKEENLSNRASMASQQLNAKDKRDGEN
ncbi:MAG: hypothetical protein LBI81_03305 [Puniceicoccales bacterium]|jgi:hypothetical protein|nr:hypothetical protein [Puniceicoccales bacterium]